MVVLVSITKHGNQENIVDLLIILFLLMQFGRKSFWSENFG